MGKKDGTKLQRQRTIQTVYAVAHSAIVCPAWNINSGEVCSELDLNIEAPDTELLTSRKVIDVFFIGRFEVKD